MNPLPPFPVVVGEVAGIPIISDPRVEGVHIVPQDAIPRLKEEVERFRWYQKHLTGR